VTSDPFYSSADEIGLLGCCLQDDRDAAQEALGSLLPGMIYDEMVKDCLDIVGDILADGGSPNVASFGRYWPKTKGHLPAPIDFAAAACSECPSAANLPYYLAGIREAHQRRKLRDAGQRLQADAGNPTKAVETCVSDLEAGIADNESATPTIYTAKQALNDFVDDLQERASRNGKLSGIPTGFYALDQKTEGLQSGELTLIGARPSIGKTALAVTMLAKCCLELRIPSLFVTVEMSKRAIMRRLVAVAAGVDMRDLKSGQLTDQQRKAITVTNARIANSPLHVVDLSTGASIGTVTAAIRRAKRKHGIAVAFVDYLQKIKANGKHEKRTGEVGEVSERSKQCAASLGIPVVMMAQLNRESEKDKGRMPRLNDLGESGKLEQDADVVCLIHRDRMEPEGKASLIIAKQRDGETGVIPLWYEGRFCRFVEPQTKIDE
jgi:replicative DNA helicase